MAKAVRRRILLLAGLMMAWMWTGAPALADDPILVLKNPRISGVHGVIEFTRDELAAMDQVEVQTGNDFIDGVGTYRGPSAFKLIDLIGRAGADRVRMTALNDFFVEIEIAELERYGAVLALELNDNALTRRDRGPIWLMYPLDDFEELQDAGFNNRLIWQLRTIELL